LCDFWLFVSPSSPRIRRPDDPSPEKENSCGLLSWSVPFIVPPVYLLYKISSQDGSGGFDSVVVLGFLTVFLVSVVLFGLFMLYGAIPSSMIDTGETLKKPAIDVMSLFPPVASTQKTGPKSPRPIMKGALNSEEESLWSRRRTPPKMMATLIWSLSFGIAFSNSFY
jgi:hypothetical protein